MTKITPVNDESYLRSGDTTSTQSAWGTVADHRNEARARDSGFVLALKTSCESERERERDHRGLLGQMQNAAQKWKLTSSKLGLLQEKADDVRTWPPLSALFSALLHERGGSSGRWATPARRGNFRGLGAPNADKILQF